MLSKLGKGMYQIYIPDVRERLQYTRKLNNHRKFFYTVHFRRAENRRYYGILDAEQK